MVLILHKGNRLMSGSDSTRNVARVRHAPTDLNTTGSRLQLSEGKPNKMSSFAGCFGILRAVLKENHSNNILINFFCLVYIEEYLKYKNKSF